jgi:hypothetical protein
VPEYGVSVAWLINTGESAAEWAGWFIREIWRALFEGIDANVPLCSFHPVVD